MKTSFFTRFVIITSFILVLPIVFFACEGKVTEEEAPTPAGEVEPPPFKPCATLNDCEVNEICLQGYCVVAPPPTCSDGIKNQDETDVDCGGSCPQKCANYKGCSQNDDCKSGLCDAGTCKPPPSCSDGIKNQDETDVDCGGPDCDKCPNYKSCSQDSDCISGKCDATGACEPNPCADGQKNNDETDVDCGGGTCEQCDNGKSCISNSDCKSGNCDMGYCKTKYAIGVSKGVVVLEKPDTTSPSVVSASPDESKEQVPFNRFPLDTEVVINFSEDMDINTVGKNFGIARYAIIPEAVHGEWSMMEAHQFRFFRADSEGNKIDLEAGCYAFNVRTGAKDAAGNKLDKRYDFRFQTIGISPKGSLDCTNFVCYSDPLPWELPADKCPEGFKCDTDIRRCVHE